MPRQQNRVAALGGIDRILLRVASLLMLVGAAAGQARDSAANTDYLLTATPSYKDLGLVDAGSTFAFTWQISNWSLATKSTHFTIDEFLPDGWITTIDPTQCDLGPSDNITVHISGTFPLSSGFLTTQVQIRDPSGTWAQTLTVQAHLRPPTGINDEIHVTNFPPTITPGTTPSFQAQFYDYEPPPSYVTSAWDWVIRLAHAGGEVDWITGSTTGSNSTSWSPTLSASVPSGYTWLRDANGHVIAHVHVSARDNDGYFHGDQKTMGLLLPPDRPRLVVSVTGPSTIELGFTASGAQSYMVYYDRNSGVPYSGSGATAGASPVTVSQGNTLTLSGLDVTLCKYFLAVRGVNDAGMGAYSDEAAIAYVNAVQCVPNDECPECPGVTPGGQLLLFSALIGVGALALRRRRKVSSANQCRVG